MRSGRGRTPSQLNDYGTQYLYGVPKEGQTLEEVEQLLLDQIALIKKRRIRGLDSRRRSSTTFKQEREKSVRWNRTTTPG